MQKNLYMREAQNKCASLGIRFCIAIYYQFEQMRAEGYTVDEAITQIEIARSISTNFQV